MGIRPPPGQTPNERSAGDTHPPRSNLERTASSAHETISQVTGNRQRLPSWRHACAQPNRSVHGCGPDLSIALEGSPPPRHLRPVPDERTVLPAESCQQGSSEHRPWTARDPPLVDRRSRSTDKPRESQLALRRLPRGRVELALSESRPEGPTDSVARPPPALPLSGLSTGFATQPPTLRAPIGPRAGACALPRPGAPTPATERGGRPPSTQTAAGRGRPPACGQDTPPSGRTRFR